MISFALTLRPAQACTDVVNSNGHILWCKKWACAKREWQVNRLVVFLGGFVPGIVRSSVSFSG